MGYTSKLVEYNLRTPASQTQWSSKIRTAYLCQSNALHPHLLFVTTFHTEMLHFLLHHNQGTFSLWEHKSRQNQKPPERDKNHTPLSFPLTAASTCLFKILLSHFSAFFNRSSFSKATQLEFYDQLMFLIMSVISQHWQQENTFAENTSCDEIDTNFFPLNTHWCKAVLIQMLNAYPQVIFFCTQVLLFSLTVCISFGRKYPKISPSGWNRSQ